MSSSLLHKISNHTFLVNREDRDLLCRQLKWLVFSSCASPFLILFCHFCVINTDNEIDIDSLEKLEITPKMFERRKKANRVKSSYGVYHLACLHAIGFIFFRRCHPHPREPIPLKGIGFLTTALGVI